MTASHTSVYHVRLVTTRRPAASIYTPTLGKSAVSSVSVPRASHLRLSVTTTPVCGGYTPLPITPPGSQRPRQGAGDETRASAVMVTVVGVVGVGLVRVEASQVKHVYMTMCVRIVINIMVVMYYTLYVYECTYIKYMYLCVYTCMCIYIYIYIYIHIYIYINIYIYIFIQWVSVGGFTPMSTATVIFTAKTTLDVFSLSREQVWTFSSLGWSNLWDEVPICSSGTQCPLYSAASLG